MFVGLEDFANVACIVIKADEHLAFQKKGPTRSKKDGSSAGADLLVTPPSIPNLRSASNKAH